MKLENAKKAYEELSSSASAIIRQLSLAGIALVWVFKSSSGTSPALDWHLVRAALFIVIALFSDVLQYLVGALVWFGYFRYKELTLKGRAEEFFAPASLNWPTWGLFLVKSACMLWAYGRYIIPFLWARFWV